MLELRPNCENCNKSLPPESTDAMICTYECTFCYACVTEVLKNVCPNCSGGFEKRPIRPKRELIQNPATQKIVLKPVDMEKFKTRLDANIDVPPDQR